MSGLTRLAGAGLLALATTLGGAAGADAQAALLGPGAAYVSGGLSGLATGELDDHLAGRGYPTFGQRATAVGIGAYRVLDSGLMLGGEWTGLVIGEEPHGAREVGIGGGYATLGVGYAFELSPRLRAYPRVGVGGGGMGLWIDEEGDVAFDSVLADPRREPGREPALSRVDVVLDVGGGVELLPGGDGAGVLLGARFGYLLTPFGSEWWLHDRQATGGPDASVAGPYIRLMVGVGWTR